jgi:hypothetical protein
MKRLEEKVYCSLCKQKTNHHILYTHELISETTDDFHWHAQYHIVQCMGCENICFVQQYGDEDTWEYIGGHREWKDIFKVYPEEPVEKSIEEKLFEKMFEVKKKEFKNAPEIIQNLYNQIADSLSMGHDILSAGGIRTLIEGICMELKINKGYLYSKDGSKIPDDEGKIRKHESLGGRIFELYDKNLIVFNQALLLQKVVKYGNDAVHRMETPSYYTLKSIIDIMEKVMYDIYELENHSLLTEESD